MWYLIRHPQTELNLQKKYHGWEYAPYTNLGAKQFQAITQYALNLQADFVYSSDLKRCELLARRIAQELQLPLTITTALRELNFGQWHGHSFADLHQRYQNEMEKWLEDPWKNAPVEGETLRQLQERCSQFKQGKTRANAIVITHGGVIAAFLKMIVDEDYWNLLPKNSECIAIDWIEGKFKVDSIPLNYSKQAN